MMESLDGQGKAKYIRHKTTKTRKSPVPACCLKCRMGIMGQPKGLAVQPPSFIVHSLTMGGSADALPPLEHFRLPSAEPPHSSQTHRIPCHSTAGVALRISLPVVGCPAAANPGQWAHQGQAISSVEGQWELHQTLRCSHPWSGQPAIEGLDPEEKD
jgi:hypothetical protein